MGLGPVNTVSGKQTYNTDLAKFYVGFRRFIVVYSDEESSTCV